MPQREKHQLAAIMFTDMVGYTLLMGKDEQYAMKLMRKNAAVQRKLVKKYGGKLLKVMGDGILASFPAASNAVQCAGEIQHQLKNESFALRIGIHLGEVIFEKGDVYGDGVNIASRLESEAKDGGICISHAVHQNIRNKPGIHTQFIEEKILKNVDDPIRLYRVEVDPASLPESSHHKPILAGSTGKRYIFGVGIVLLVFLAFIFYRSQNSKSTTPYISTLAETEKSIAVLPFKNDSEEKESSQHICNGIMEAILNNLSNLSELRLISRQSVEQYRASTKTVPEIARELGVAFILVGSVRRHDDQLRIYAQLLDATTDQPLYSDSFDGEMKDVFLFENEIAKEIAEKLNTKISLKEKERIESVPTHDLEAYEFYLKGKENHAIFQLSRNIEDIENSLTYYNKSIEVDPEFALPYVSIAEALWDGYSTLNVYNDRIIDTVISLNNKALLLDSDLAEAYFLRGRAFLERSEFKHFEEDLEKALKINPNQMEAHILLGRYSFQIKSDYKEGIRLLKKAEKLGRGINLILVFETLSWLYLEIGSLNQSEFYGEKAINLGHWGQALFWTYTHMGKYDEALKEAERLYSLYPNEEFTLWYNAVINMYLKNYSTSEFFFNKLLKEFQDKGQEHELNRYRNRFGYVLWQNGEKKRAMEEFNKSINYLKDGMQLKRYIFRDNSAYNLAAIYAFLGNKEEAYKWLEELNKYSWHWGYPFHIQRDPMFDNLREDETFQGMVKEAQKEKIIIRAEIEKIEKGGKF